MVAGEVGNKTRILCKIEYWLFSYQRRIFKLIQTSALACQRTEQVGLSNNKSRISCVDKTRANQ